MKRKKFRYWLKCISCGKVILPNVNNYTCECGGLFLVERDEDYIATKIGVGKAARVYFDNIRYGIKQKQYPYGSGVFMWRDHILPGFPDKAILSLREGFTDLFQPPKWLRQEVGLDGLFIKQEGQGPSESFKDRGMPVAVSQARYLQIYHPEFHIQYVACASTGDTSASAGEYCAYHRDLLRCIVFLPYDKISNGQLAQAMMSGAIVIAIKHPAGFDGCMRLIKEFCAHHPEIVLVNSANAFRLVGQETIALEIFQDRGWRVPRWISDPCGNGGSLVALLGSCLRAKKLGLIDKLPGIIIPQTKAANTLVRWVRSGFSDYMPGKFQDTIASAMNIQDPVSFPRIQQLYKQFEILAYDVSEAEIQRTRAQFNRGAVDLCPQGAVAVNALMQAKNDGYVKEKDYVVTVSTASGLKFVDSAIDHHTHGSRQNFANPYLVEATGTIEGIEKLIKKVI